jgi:hypothetical protein
MNTALYVAQLSILLLTLFFVWRTYQATKGPELKPGDIVLYVNPDNNDPRNNMITQVLAVHGDSVSFRSRGNGLRVQLLAVARENTSHCFRSSSADRYKSPQNQWQATSMTPTSPRMVPLGGRSRLSGSLTRFPGTSGNRRNLPDILFNTALP